MPQKPYADPSKFIGRDLGTVTLLKELGRGSNGVVFAGFQRTLKRQVAVKILLKGPQTSDASRRLFDHEAEVVAALSHPNIIPIFEMGEAEDCYYQVMQLVKGSDLETVISRKLKNPIAARRTLSPDECLRIMMQVLDGLGYAHDEGVIHQDIKPANTLMDERTGRPQIADFGIARAVMAETGNSGILVGSPLYMAPERVSRKPSDLRSDVYSTGVMLFKMLAGTLPLSEQDPIRLLSKKSTNPDSIFTMRPSEASEAIDLGMEKVLLKAMASNPNERYGSCREFADDLEKYQANR